LNKHVRTRELYALVPDHLAPLFASCEYPWEMLTSLKSYILGLIEKGIPGYTLASKDVLIGENVKIYPTATIEGPAVIGSNCEIRPGAFIRGSVIIGSGCVIGNSSELKNCILLDNVQIPHYNYVGDSVLGNKSHLGAGVICANLRLDRANVPINLPEGTVETGMRKLGAILGDQAEAGCNSVLHPGTILMKRAIVLSCAFGGVLEENTIVAPRIEMRKIRRRK